jgi:hypothetical protein
MSKRFGFDDPDPYTIMYHDAALSAFSAIQLAANNGAELTPTAVKTQFKNLNLTNTVPAAIGKLSFSGTQNGRPLGACINYRQIGPDAPFELPRPKCYPVQEPER